MSHRLHPNIDLLDKSFQHTDISSYDLVMQLSDRRFSFAIFNPSANRFIGLGSEQLPHAGSQSQVASLEAAVAKHPVLLQDFRHVYFSYGGRRSTLVPLALFDSAKALQYLAYNQPVREHDTVSTDILNLTPAANVYAIPADLKSQVNSRWPKMSVRHLSTVLIESLGINFKHVAGDDTVFVNIREECFDMVHFRHSRLHFYNLFRFHTREDFIYFLLAALEQLELNPENVRVVFSGGIVKESQLFDLAYRYIRHCTFLEMKDTFGYAHVLDEINLHEYYTLFGILQCVS